MGLSKTGRSCLLVTRVSGWSRVPAPPARMIPFLLTEPSVPGAHGDRHRWPRSARRSRWNGSTLSLAPDPPSDVTPSIVHSTSAPASSSTDPDDIYLARAIRTVTCAVSHRAELDEN